MGFESFIALCILSFTAAFTPGPNNALVAASGANFGFRRTFPHVLGISLGFPVMIFIVGLFLGSFFNPLSCCAKCYGGLASPYYSMSPIKLPPLADLDHPLENAARFDFTKRPFFNGLIPRGGRWQLRSHRNSQPLMHPCKRP